MITLCADRIAAVSDTTQLAPELSTGEAVRYHGPSGKTLDATVAELDLSHWWAGVGGAGGGGRARGSPAAVPAPA